jgi:hypothetical protein
VRRNSGRRRGLETNWGVAAVRRATKCPQIAAIV